MAGDVRFCGGCRDDYYNHGGNGWQGKGCWSLENAKVVTRYRLDWWTAPTQNGAFQKVETNSCHHAPGRYQHYDRLPDCVAVEERRRINAEPQP